MFSETNSTKSNGQTGPKTALGKQVSAQNARKSAIFVKGYLPWEDIEAKQQLHQELCAQWDASDPTRQMLILTFEQGHLEYERIMYAQKQKIEAAAMNLNIAQAFLDQAGLNQLSAKNIPAWYFVEDQTQKKYAIWYDRVWVEAAKLQKHFHDSLVPKIAQDYPNLYKFVLQTYPANTSFLVALGQRFGQSTPSLNLAKLMNQIHEDYGYHLQWEADPQRYQIIIDGLRAQLMFEAMDLEKNSRYLTSIQNRMLKAANALKVLKDSQGQVAGQVITLPSPSQVAQKKALPSNSGQGNGADT